MLAKSAFILATAAIITAASFAATASTASAGVKALADRNHGYTNGRGITYGRAGYRLRATNPRCQKYLTKFQRTGDNYYLRLFRLCLKKIVQ